MILERVNSIQKILSKYESSSHKIQFMAVTKYASLEQTRAVIDAGVTLIGENKVQAGLQKLDDLNRKNIKCHLIGHLQSNKVLKAVDRFDMIQSVDSLKLLTKIGESTKAKTSPYPVLLEINIGKEPQKHGFLPDNIEKDFEVLIKIQGVDIQGIMMIPPYQSDPEKCRPYFREGKKLYDRLKSVYSGIHILSMGMSADFEVALQEGSHLVRIGSYLFK